MIQPTNSSNRILRPAKNWFIGLTLICALLANMLPVGRLPGFPDWVALTLAFWCVREPLRIGMGIAFLLGLTMDIVDASVIGQHPLAYIMLAYAANSLSRRILWFPLMKQAMHILPMLLLAQLVMLGIRLATGAQFPGLIYFVSSFVAILFWYPFSFLLLLPQYQPQEKDENRPI